MTPRAGRPSHLKPVPHGVPSVLAYQAEHTAGLTPRTPYSSRPAEFVVSEDEDDSIDIKIHRSPGAPITPAPARRKIKSRLGEAEHSNRRWKFVTWTAVLALVVIVLLSLYNVDPRHALLPQTRSDTLTDWIDIVSQNANDGTTRDIRHPTRTVDVLHPTHSVPSGETGTSKRS